MRNSPPRACIDTWTLGTQRHDQWVLWIGCTSHRLTNYLRLRVLRLRVDFAGAATRGCLEGEPSSVFILRLKPLTVGGMGDSPGMPIWSALGTGLQQRLVKPKRAHR